MRGAPSGSWASNRAGRSIGPPKGRLHQRDNSSWSSSSRANGLLRASCEPCDGSASPPPFRGCSAWPPPLRVGARSVLCAFCVVTGSPPSLQFEYRRLERHMNGARLRPEQERLVATLIPFSTTSTHWDV